MLNNPPLPQFFKPLLSVAQEPGVDVGVVGAGFFVPQAVGLGLEFSNFGLSGIFGLFGSFGSFGLSGLSSLFGQKGKRGSYQLFLFNALRTESDT